MLILKILWQRLVNSENKTCPRCEGTEEELHNSCLKLREVLSPLGIKVILEKKELSIDEFKKDPMASNKIWIGDKTLEEWLGATTGKNPCCDVCGDNECRTVEMKGEVYETVPESLIIKAGLIAAASMLPVERKRFIEFKKFQRGTAHGD
ncbi:MAG: DUF2703 domain-containing protein [Thermodesulfovibrionales bacterium]|nr:DUF2703 domain-containing protein [Thermodesulfovibrionales bacterium]